MDNVANKFFSKTTIAGKEYQITKMGGLEGMKMSMTLTKVIAPLLGGFVDSMRGNDEFETPQTFTDLALVLGQQIDNLEVEFMISKLLKGCTCDGKDLENLDAHFQGEPENLIELLAFALKENFYKVFMENPLLTRLKSQVVGMMEDS